ncbi:uncharacterized protein EI90DRAFT_3040761 [Cantharellus anzutake]|uniref:uncharacterized protein n=1 Tax=Cantharellus anzutake TaxID=1750568 RepID=UPI001905E211|nr:uncharacterized protein EI90DRAFT_3040761 [Cantharellus anzutake]KAF8339192.1 hypothetical protein EI90DRAFT_3040761 [Cantharellus anzutake]
MGKDSKMDCSPPNEDDKGKGKSRDAWAVNGNYGANDMLKNRHQRLRTEFVSYL